MKGMKEALKKTKAKKIFICNIMTKLGETNNFSVLDFVNEAEKYMGCDFDHVIYNADIPPKKRVEKFKKEEPGILDLVKIDKNLDKEKFIGIKIIEKNGPIVHNPEKLAKLIMSLF